jgi:hypothetical protein
MRPAPPSSHKVLLDLSRFLVFVCVIGAPHLAMPAGQSTFEAGRLSGALDGLRQPPGYAAVIKGISHQRQSFDTSASQSTIRMGRQLSPQDAHSEKLLDFAWRWRKYAAETTNADYKVMLLRAADALEQAAARATGHQAS